MPETQASRSRHILDTIVASKLEEVGELRARGEDLESRAGAAAPPRDFRAALQTERVGVIAEVKRRSPGAGDIRPGLVPGELARRYQDAGAAAVSVLTDQPFFGGTLEDLRSVRAAVDIPVLRKDFTLDPLQVLEARAAGADAVLLIVRILEDALLLSLRERAESLGMTALVEVHTRAELDRALETGATVVGINNRDLTTFRTDLSVTEELLTSLPDHVCVVSESGIRSADDVIRLGGAGVNGVLVGESILTADDPGEAVQQLSGHPRARRG